MRGVGEAPIFLVLLHYGKEFTMKESIFQKRFLDRIRAEFPGCYILKNDASYIQGFPDWTVLYKDKWVVLEMKRSSEASRQPNQEYYVKQLDRMSYSAFVCPENADEVLDEIRSIFSS